MIVIFHGLNKEGTSPINYNYLYRSHGRVTQRLLVNCKNTDQLNLSLTQDQVYRKPNYHSLMCEKCIVFFWNPVSNYTRLDTVLSELLIFRWIFLKDKKEDFCLNEIAIWLTATVRQNYYLAWFDMVRHNLTFFTVLMKKSLIPKLHYI